MYNKLDIDYCVKAAKRHAFKKFIKKRKCIHLEYIDELRYALHMYVPD